MVLQNIATSAGNIQKAQLARHELADGCFIGRIQNGSACATTPSDLISQLYGWKGRMVALLEPKFAQCAPTQSAGGAAQSFRVGQRILNRQTHVWWRQLRQHRAVSKFHE